MPFWQLFRLEFQAIISSSTITPSISRYTIFHLFILSFSEVKPELSVKLQYYPENRIVLAPHIIYIHKSTEPKIWVLWEQDMKSQLTLKVETWNEREVAILFRSFFVIFPVIFKKRLLHEKRWKWIIWSFLSSDMNEYQKQFSVQFIRFCFRIKCLSTNLIPSIIFNRST